LDPNRALIYERIFSAESRFYLIAFFRKAMRGKTDPENPVDPVK